VENAGVNIVLFAEGLRPASDELVNVVGNPADEVRDRSGGVRRVWPPLKYGDLQVGAAAPRLRRGAHPRCITSNDYQPFFAHAGHGRCTSKSALYLALFQAGQTAP